VVTNNKEIRKMERRNFQRRDFNSGPREMHKVTCSDCGNEAEVPFKPAEGRPVYCRDCYGKHKPQRF
jgi:CxxC-x17-CxxC domain-containing protein